MTTLPKEYRGLQSKPGILEFSTEFSPPIPGAQMASYHMLVARAKPKKKTASGLILTADTIEADSFTDYIGKVLAIGPLAYNRLDLKDVPAEQRVKVGDVVGFKQFSGYRLAWSPQDETGACLKDEDGDVVMHEYLIMRDVDVQIRYENCDILSQIRVFAT